MKISSLLVAIGLATLSTMPCAKIPPAPPPDPAAAAAKAAKDKIVADAAKLQQAAAEDRAVKSFQANMKKSGKPVPKPVPVVAPPPAPAPATVPMKKA